MTTSSQMLPTTCVGKDKGRDGYHRYPETPRRDENRSPLAEAGYHVGTGFPHGGDETRKDRERLGVGCSIAGGHVRGTYRATRADEDRCCTLSDRCSDSPRMRGRSQGGRCMTAVCGGPTSPRGVDGDEMRS